MNKDLDAMKERSMRKSWGKAFQAERINSERSRGLPGMLRSRKEVT